MSGPLENIQSPEDLRALPADRLADLAAEIRKRIIDVVGRTGGHLASNLGTVELTIALHRVFDFRRDRIVFDVGHQAYCHKILTGRNDRFDTLRTRGGISGFPSPVESEYDPFVVGHASTAISQALGLACAGEISGSAGHIVAVVGDGSMTGGLAYEGLNQAGHIKERMLVVLNDNGMAISPTVGAMQGYLGRLRAAPLYNELRDELTELLSKIPVLGNRMEGLVEKALDAARRVLSPGHIFAELGFRYFGPVDGHNLNELASTLEDLKKLPGPVLLHVLTKKGHGFEPASTDPARFHSATPESVTGAWEAAEPPAPVAASGSEAYTKIFSRELVEFAQEDKRVVAITAAMPAGTGLDAFQEKHPRRYFDVGLAESHAITFAGALAKGGLKPVVVIYSTFLQRAYDQILHDLCLQPGCGVIIGIDRAGLVGNDGPTHHGLFDIAFLRHMPRMVLCAPKDAGELGAMLKAAAAMDCPVAIRYPRDRAIDLGEHAPVETGRSERLRDGGDCTILAYGAAVEWALGAADELAGSGVASAVVNARFAKPVDEEAVRAAFESGGPVVTVEDGALAGGFGSAVLECANGLGLEARRVTRIGVPDRFIEHASRKELLAELGLSAKGVAERVRKEIDR